MTTPNLQLAEVPEAILTASDEINDTFWSVDALLHLAVLADDVLAPPASAVQGNRYLIPAGATGAWAGRTNHIAYRGPLGWIYFVPRPGWLCSVAGVIKQFVGGSWVDASGGAATIITATDESATFPNSRVLTEGSNITIDNGTPGQTIISASGGQNLLDAIPASPNAMDDEFNDQSFDTTKWTWVNQGSATVQEDSASEGHLILTTPASASDNYRAIVQTIPGGNWRFRCKMFANFPASNFAHTGLFLRRTANGRLFALGPLYNGGYGMYLQAMTSLTTYSSTPAFVAAQSIRSYYYLDIEYNGANLIFRYTDRFGQWNPLDINTWTTLFTQAPATFLGGVPDQIGLCGDSANSQPVLGYFDWFRRIS